MKVEMEWFQSMLTSLLQTLSVLNKSEGSMLWQKYEISLQNPVHPKGCGTLYWPLLTIGNGSVRFGLRGSKLKRIGTALFKIFETWTKPNRTRKPLNEPWNIFQTVKTAVSWFSFGFQHRSNFKFFKNYNISLFFTIFTIFKMFLKCENNEKIVLKQFLEFFFKFFKIKNL